MDNSLLGEIILAQLREEAKIWQDWLQDMLDHPPIASPVVMICDRPWRIWWDEVRDPVRFVWVEDRLT